MPTAINGIGTWYYGKRHRLTVTGTCDQCGNTTQLKSYDTTKYFIVFFVPLVPLRKYRVVGECAVCERHRAAPLKKWEASKEDDIGRVLEALRNDPDDPAAVTDAIGVASAYQDEPLLDKVAGVAKPMTDNADVQAALGSSYAYFSRHEEATEALRRSLEVKDDPEVHELLAVQRLRSKQPDEARQHLQHIEQGSDPEKVGYLLLLAEGYQATGQHDEAVAMMDRAAEIQPELGEDKQFARLRKQAEKYREANHPIASKTLAPAGKSGYEEDAGSGKMAALIGPAVAALALCIYLGAAWAIGNSRTVYVLNGLGQPYTATVGGETVQLRPHGRQEISLPEGTHTVSGSGDGFAIEEQKIALETSFWSRPFVSYVFLINPDQTALVSWESIYYGENVNALPEGDLQIHVGEPYYEFDDIDYPFQEFPDEIEVSSSSAQVLKTRLAVFDPNEYGPGASYVYLASQLGEDYVPFLKRLLQYNPDNEAAINTLATVVAPDEFLEIARPRLDGRPLRLAWHRAWQSINERHRPEYDLEAEYRERYEQNPDNPALAYLLGRAVSDPREAVSYYKQAAEGPQPSPYGLHALAFQYVATGEFAKAVPHAERAVRLMPEEENFARTLQLAREGAGDLDPVIEENRRQQRQEGMTYNVVNEVRLLVEKGDVAAAKARLQLHVKESPDNNFGDYLESVIAYATGDIQTYADLNETETDDEPDFFLALETADFEAAEAVVRLWTDEYEMAPVDLIEEHLTLYLLATQQDRSEKAEQFFELAVEGLSAGDAEQQFAAKALSGEQPPEVERVLAIPMLPDPKRTLMAVFGTRFPEDQEQYFDLARELNFERYSPYLFLRSYLGDS